MWRLNLLGLLIALAMSGAVSAQDGPAPNATTPAPAPKLQTIFDYKGELGLTDQQIDKLKAEVKNLGVGITAGRKKITELESEYAALVATNPPVEKVRAKLMAIAQEQAELKLLDYVTSRNITSTLKPEQLKKWHEIQDKMRKATAPK